MAFSRLRGRPIVVAELRAGIHILGYGFQVQSPCRITFVVAFAHDSFCLKRFKKGL